MLVNETVLEGANLALQLAVITGTLTAHSKIMIYVLLSTVFMVEMVVVEVVLIACPSLKSVVLINCTYVCRGALAMLLKMCP